MIPLTRLAIVQLSHTLGKGSLKAGIEMHPRMHRWAGLVYFIFFSFFFYVQVDSVVRRLLGGFPGMGGFPGKYVTPCYL